MSKAYGVLVIHNPGPNTKVELRGMEGEVPEEPYPNAASALRDVVKARKERDLAYVVVYHGDNGQLCLNSAKELLEEGLLTRREKIKCYLK